MKKTQWEKLQIPTRFDDIEQWCRDGVIEKDICLNLGVGVTTFNQWKRDYPEITEVLKRGKAIADQVVVSSLYKRAIGFFYDEVHYEITGKATIEVKITDGEVQELKESPEAKRKVITKYVVPDVTAAIYWTKNRMPEQWRDRHEIDVSDKREITNEERADKILGLLESGATNGNRRSSGNGEVAAE